MSLSSEDRPIIRNAIMRRLDKEPGVAVADIAFTDLPDGVRVGVWLLRMDSVQEGGLVDTWSKFDLPKEFFHSHLVNEIDQIAEHSKQAKRNAQGRLIFRPEAANSRQAMLGTGLRGLWPQ